MTTILHICDWYHPIGGAEKLLFDTLELLENEGHRNVVVYNKHPKQKPSGVRAEYSCFGLELFEYFHPFYTFLARRAIVRIEEIIQKHSPDVCHIHNLQNPFVTEYLVKRLPTVRSIHDPRLYCFTQWRLLPDKSICPYPLGQDCINQGCITNSVLPRTSYELNARFVVKNLGVHQQIQLLISESRSETECLLQNGFTPEQIAWLPNCTTIASEKDSIQYEEKYFDPDQKIVLFVGRASYEKGAHVLVDACEFLKSDCKIVIITAGPLLEEIRQHAKQYGDRIEVIPGLCYEETKKYYARASVVVVPSVWLENFCLVGLEAFANRKPVIGSRIGGIQDWLKENETGWFFEAGNARDLAGKIDTAMANPTLLRSMGVAAYAGVGTYYNGKIYIFRLIEIYLKGMQRYLEEKRH